MPVNVVKTEEDERHWQKAKALAEQQGHSKDWAYVMGIYQKMKGSRKSASLNPYKIVKEYLNEKRGL